MIDHLDRIEKLGFTIEIIWNRFISISYDVDIDSQSFSPDISILTCYFDSNFSVEFIDIIENSCDFFYSWYNKNLEKLKEWDNLPVVDNYSKLTDSCLGDITKQVYRDYNIDNLLD